MSQQINLFAPELKKKKQHFTAVNIAQVLLLLAVCLAGFYAYQRQQMAKLEKEFTVASRWSENARAMLQKSIDEVDGGKRGPALRDEVVRVEAQVNRFKEIERRLGSGAQGATLGFSAYMGAFSRQTISGLWLTGFSINGAGDEITLSGRTLQPELVPVYIKRLNHEPAMKGRLFADLEMYLPPPEKVEAKVEPNPKDKSGTRLAPVKKPSFLEFTLQSTDIVRGPGGK